MKTNFIKKATALMSVIAIISSFAITASANTISSLPYSNDFSKASNSGINTSIWIQASWGTGFDASGKPIEVVEDDEEHGKVVKLHNTSGETQAVWTFPQVTSGKYVFEIDVKSIGSNYYLTANQTDHTDSVNIVYTAKDNSILAGGQSGTLITTYSQNEWKRFRVLFDIEEKTMTTFVDGESGTVSSIYDYPRAMEFTAITPGGVLFDNINTYMVDETVKPELIIEENGEPIGNFASDATESFVMYLDSAEFFEAPEVVLTNLGTDILSADDDTIEEAEVVLVDGKAIVTPEDGLTLGNRYSLGVAAGTTDMFGRKVDTAPMTFVVAEDDGWKTMYEYEDDFSGETTGPVNYAASARFGKDRGDGKKAFYFVTAGNGEVLENSDYTGCKAVKITGTGDSHMQFTGFTAKKGRIEFGGKMQTSSTGVTIGFDDGQWNFAPLIKVFANKDITGDGTADKVLSFVNGPEFINEGFIDFNYVIDLDNKKSYITYDDKTYEATLNTSGISNLAGRGAQTIRFLIANNASLTLDDFNASYKYIPAMVESIEATDIADGKASTKTQLVIKFSEAMKEDTLSKIKISDGANDVAYTGAWNAESKTYVITFDSKLKSNKHKICNFRQCSFSKRKEYI